MKKTRKIVSAALSIAMIFSAMTCVYAADASAVTRRTGGTTTTSESKTDENTDTKTETDTENKTGTSKASTSKNIIRRTDKSSTKKYPVKNTTDEKTDTNTDTESTTTAKTPSRRTDNLPVGSYAIDEKNFPDSAFRAYVSKFDKDGDAVLSKTEIAKVTHMEVTDSSISSFKGIEIFNYLEELLASGLPNTSLDLTGSSVKYLIWTDGKLKKLDVSGLANITQVIVDNNNLTSLVIGKQSGIEAIKCRDNKLSTLDVSGCPNLVVLEAESNRLSSVDVSNNKKLKMLLLADNGIKSIDLVNNTEMTELSLDKSVSVTAKAGGYIESYAKSNGNEFKGTGNFALYVEKSGGKAEKSVGYFDKWADAIKYINNNAVPDGYMMITVENDCTINGKLTLPKKGTCKQLTIAGNNGRRKLYFNDGNEIYPNCDILFRNIELAKSVVRNGETYYGYVNKISSGDNTMTFVNSRLICINELRSNVDMYFVDSTIYSKLIAKDHVVFRGTNSLRSSISAKGLVFEGNCDLLFLYDALEVNMKIGKDGIRYDSPVNFLYTKTHVTVDKYNKLKKAGDLSEIAYDLSEASNTMMIKWEGLLPFESSAFNVIDSKGKTSVYQFASYFINNIIITDVTKNDTGVLKLESGASVINGKVTWYTDKEKEVTVYISRYYPMTALKDIIDKYFNTKVRVPSGVVNEYGAQIETRYRFRECKFDLSFVINLRKSS